MKKTVLVGLIAAFALAVLTTGVAFAQDPQPPTPRGGMGPGAGMGPMRSFAVNGEQGPMHEYMVTALADALGISVDDLATRQAAGERAYDIAIDLGFAADEIPALLREARNAAWEAAAADGVISQEQLAGMQARQAGMGFGNCDGTGQRLGQGMGGWRFQQPNP